MPERSWREVERVLAEVLDLTDAEYREYLERNRVVPEVRDRVERLLRASRNSEGFLERPALEVSDRLVGARLGPWRLKAVIGTGGMGTVYRAEREGGEFTQTAAVKLIASGRLSRSTERRFREERQILAHLEHPNVARLIDGGVAPDGSPWLAMEYVEGVPIDLWCRERALDRHARLRLFRQVCETVQYAHQRLVVHCDLKPANILITQDGTPKLLDFGIARMLRQDVEGTATLMPALTPDYASPEQVRGDSIGAASDIYSLGVLLHELTTSRRPYRLTGKPLDEILETVCRKEIEKPGTGAADLDAIILKALQKDPQRRYGSAEQLAADIQRYLEGHPVAARPAVFLYRARKFVVRRAIPLAVAAALLGAVLSGLAGSLWEARRAERQREIAQRRFDEARRLAYTVIHEVQPKLADINGTVALRKNLIEKTMVYLEALRRDAEDSPELMRELLASYVALAQVAADPGLANVGDQRRAAQILRQGEALANTLQRVDSSNPASVHGLVAFYRALSRQMLFYGPAEEAKAHAGRAFEIAERAAAARPGDVTVQDDIAVAAIALSDALTRDPGDVADRRIALLERSLEITRRQLQFQPSGADALRSRAALAAKNVSAVWLSKNDYPRALRYALEAREIDRQRLAENPGSPSLQMDLAFDIGSIGWIYYSLGDYAKAAENMRENVDLREHVADGNPDDRRASDRLAYALRDLALAERSLGDSAAAERHLVRAARLYTRLAQSGPLVTQSLARFAQSAYDLGMLERQRGNQAAACRWLAKMNTLLDEYERRTKGPADSPEQKTAMRAALRSCP